MAAHFTQDSLTLLAQNRAALNRQFNSEYQISSTRKSASVARSSLTCAASSTKDRLSPSLISEGVEYSKGIGVNAKYSRASRLDIIRRELNRRKKKQMSRHFQLKMHLDKPEELETEEIVHTLPAELGAEQFTGPETEGCERYLKTEPDPVVPCCSYLDLKCLLM
mmetsp:Transcript_16769/g.30010  ORF Transcript_16769/g.30010 Transcript_16769/m.30010 type:complete len:165 (-) Transcript_16769:33-527(-)|eukprot:CAMPEP_0204918518 /NCGR_PEP_ID=MMETSP1397-20131031/16210_1 /ASSEMBLY_ACC=CAM_ASM_000891 /TAXON_ID=49980 /ORGANISM="Climacostomum Climacostomum virens, Strain Stock W-24" /LENGTH=164 /DNA_ID=CAMNT_0052091839 /DNA_START=15 /DNA_END=509 /DNA_ORIENTATION=-